MSCRRIAIAAVVLTWLVIPAWAEPVTYIDSAVGTGSLGGVAFTNELITLTGTADTFNITEFTSGILSGTFAVTLNSVTVSVNAGAPATFTVPSAAFGNQSAMIAGLSQGTSAMLMGDILDVFNTGFGSYALATNINLSGPAFPNAGSMFGTSAGDFIINSITGNGTFQAVVVPEPSSFVLGAITAVLGLRAWARRPLHALAR
jgi:hypothetical protein